MLVFLPFNYIFYANIKLFAQPFNSIAIIVFSISAQIFRVKAFKYTKDPSLIAPGMYFSVVVAAILDIVFFTIHQWVI